MLTTDGSGVIPEHTPPEFFAKHFAAYVFARQYVEGSRVLDVGFGDGYGAAFLSDSRLSRHAREVVGLDIVEANVARARDKYRKANLHFQSYDGTVIPFPNDSFDCVIACQVIEHVPQARLDAWLAELRRVVKPSGMLLITTLNLEHERKPGTPYRKNPDHTREFTAPELRGVLESAFREVRMQGLFYTRRHRLFRRLRKWGLARGGPAAPLIRRYFQSVSARDFIVVSGPMRAAVDLYAVCRK